MSDIPNVHEEDIKTPVSRILVGPNDGLQAYTIAKLRKKSVIIMIFVSGLTYFINGLSLFFALSLIVLLVCWFKK